MVSTNEEQIIYRFLDGMEEEILSIASDLREGSMTTNEAKEHLLRLFGVIGSVCDCSSRASHKLKKNDNRRNKFIKRKGKN